VHSRRLVYIPQDVLCAIVRLIECSPRAYKEHFDKKRGEAEQLCDELNTKKTKQLSKQDKIRIQEQKKEAKSSLKELQKTWKTEVYEILKQTAVKKEWFWPDFKDAAAWRPRCPRVRPSIYKQSRSL